MPAATPLTTPVAEPTPAVPGNELDQVPNGEVSVNVILLPTQTELSPVIGTGTVFTVINLVDVHPAEPQVIVSVPAKIPVTIPVDEPTVAIAGEPDVQVAPAVVSDNVMVEPTQTLSGPVGLIGPITGSRSKSPGVDALAADTEQVSVQR